MMNFLGWVIAVVLVVTTICIHYEVIRIVSDLVIPWALKRFHDRRVMMLMIITLMFGHIIEIWIFAVTMFFMTLTPELGYLSGNFDGSLNTFLYFSSVNYTSTGASDIIPHGSLHSISASEALAGLMMIAWSASFTFLKMEQIWSMRRRKGAGKKPER